MCPKISVVIPLYNRESFVKETLLSIERQVLQPYEVIIVDDHSTDNSVVAVNDFKKLSCLNINILKNGFKKGMSGALNWGIKESGGNFIAMQDSDDLWEPLHLSNLFNALCSHSDSSIAFSAIQVFGTAMDTQQKAKDFRMSVDRCLQHAFEKDKEGLWVSNSNLLTTLLTYGVPFRCPASLIRKDFFSESNLTFDEDLTYTLDSQFMTMAAYFTPFIYVDTVGFSLRRHAENDGDVRYGNKICSSFDVRVVKLKQFFSQHNISLTERKALKHRLWCLQVCVAEQEVIGCGLWGRAKASWRLFYKVPTWSSFKSIVKLLLGIGS